MTILHRAILALACGAALASSAYVTPAVAQPFQNDLVVAAQISRKLAQDATVRQAAYALAAQAKVDATDGYTLAPVPAAGTTLAGGGLVPSSSGAPTGDGFGINLGYCAWDNGTSTSTPGYIAGRTGLDAVTLAVVSPGADNKFTTTCAQIALGQPASSDDFYVAYTGGQILAGVQGTMYFSDPVAALSDLSTLDPSVLKDGQVRLVKANNQLYRYTSGSGWSSMTQWASGPAAGDINYTTGNVSIGAATTQRTLTVQSAAVPVGLVSTGNRNGVDLLDSTAAALNAFFGYDTAAKQVRVESKQAGSMVVLSTPGGSVSVDAVGALNAAGGINAGGITATSLTASGPITTSAIQSSGPMSIASTSLTLSSPVTVSGVLTASNGVTSTDGTFSGNITADTVSASTILVNGNAVWHAGNFDPSNYVSRVQLQNALLGGGGYSQNVVVDSNLDGLHNNTTGLRLTAMGPGALKVNATGNDNTAYGFQTLYSNTSGSGNTAIGSKALTGASTASNNTAVGAAALVSVTTGGSNVAVGTAAGQNVKTGTLNVFVGNSAGAGATTALTGSVVLGNYSNPTSDNSIYIADGNGNERIHVDGTGDVSIGTSTADARLTVAGGPSDVGGEYTIQLLSSNAAAVPVAVTGNSAGTTSIMGGALSIGSHRGGQIDFIGGAAASNPGVLLFRTGTGSGGTAQPERMRIDASGNVIIGSSAGTGQTKLLNVEANVDASDGLQITNKSSGASASSLLRLSSDSTPAGGLILVMNSSGRSVANLGGVANGAAIYSSSAAVGGLSIGTTAGPLRFFSNSIGTERVRLDTNGVFAVGGNDGVQTRIGGTILTPTLQNAGTTVATSSALFSRWNSDSSSPGQFFLKSRGMVVGDYTVVQNGDQLGRISWAGTDGAKAVEGANIMAIVSGMPGVDAMPTRLAFSTNAGTSVSPVERMTLDSNGNLLLGISSALRARATATSYTPTFQVAGTDAGASGLLARYSNDTGSSYLTMLKSRSTTTGGFGLVQSNDSLGGLSFNGTDGTQALEAARVMGEVDGAAVAGNMPGRLTFLTTPAGSSTPQERMRIDNQGNVGIGTTAPQRTLHVQRDADSAQGIRVENASSGAGASASIVLVSDDGAGLVLTHNSTTSTGAAITGGAYGAGIYTNNALTNGLSIGTSSGPLKFFSASTAAERMRLDTAGHLGIGTTTPGSWLAVMGTNAAPSTSGSPVEGVARFGSNGTTTLLDVGVDGTGTPYSWIQSRMRGDYSTNYNLSLNPNGGTVLVGMSTPVGSGTLQVDAAADIIAPTTNAALTIRSQTAGKYAGIEIAGNANVLGTTSFALRQDASNRAVIANRANAEMLFSINNAEQMRIDTAGNLLVGRTTNSGLGVIQADGSIDASNTAAVGIYARATTAATSASLYLAGNNNAAATAGFMLRQDTTNKALIWNYYNSDISFATNNLARMHIHADGSVGIGRVASGYLLDVNGLIRTTGAVTTTSDARVKHDITTLDADEMTRRLMKVRAVHYALNWNNQKNYGYIAQELEPLFPEMVTRDSDGMYGVQYTQMLPVLTAVAQRHQQLIDDLQRTKMGNETNKWVESSDQRGRMFFEQNEKTVLRGYGDIAVELRNGEDATVAAFRRNGDIDIMGVARFNGVTGGFAFNPTGTLVTSFTPGEIIVNSSKTMRAAVRLQHGPEGGAHVASARIYGSLFGDETGIGLADGMGKTLLSASTDDNGNSNVRVNGSLVVGDANSSLIQLSGGAAISSGADGAVQVDTTTGVRVYNPKTRETVINLGSDGTVQARRFVATDVVASYTNCDGQVGAMARDANGQPMVCSK